MKEWRFSLAGLLVALLCTSGAALGEVAAGVEPVEEYLRRLERLQGALDVYAAELDRQDEGATTHGRDRLEREMVALRGVRESGEGLHSQNPRGWIEKRIAEVEGPRQARQLSRRLEAVRGQVERSYDKSPRTGAGRRLLDDARSLDRRGEDSMAEILGEDSYRRRIEKAEREREAGAGGSDAGFHRRLRRRIGPLYEDGDLQLPTGGDWELPRFGWLGGGTAGGWTVVLWLIGAIGVVLFVYLIVQAVMAPRRRGREDSADEEEDDEADTSDEAVRTKAPTELSASAARLARSGNFREAVRVLYLELLARLYRGGLIRYDRTRTNWEYGIQLRGTPEVKVAFDRFTSIFDGAWYGREPCDEDSYRTCREEVLSIAEHLPMDA